MQADALVHVCALQICTAMMVAFTPVTEAQARQHLTNDQRETVQMFKQNVASVCFIVSLQNRWVITLSLHRRLQQMKRRQPRASACFTCTPAGLEGQANTIGLCAAALTQLGAMQA